MYYVHILNLSLKAAESFLDLLLRTTYAITRPARPARGPRGVTTDSLRSPATSGVNNNDGPQSVDP